MLNAKKKTITRVTAKALIIAMAVMAGCLYPMPHRAYAQLKVTRVAVLDFEVDKGMDPVVGREGADALSVELSGVEDFEVISRDKVQKAIRDVTGNLGGPLDTQAQLKIGKALDVNAVISGKMANEVSRTNPPYASIRMAVTQLDIESGEPTNGALVTGETSSKLVGIDPSVLLDEAINKAAALAVRSMRSTMLPSGMVLATARDNTVVINRGAQDGIVQGMRLVVTREMYNAEKQTMDRHRVGEIRIFDVEPEQSTGTIEQSTLGITTGDLVKAIYELPAVVSPLGARSESPQEQKTSVFQKVILPMAAVLGLASLLTLGGGSKGTVTDSPSGPSAAAGSDGSTVILNFSTPGQISRDNILGHLIYRSTVAGFGVSEATLIDVVQGASTTYTDTVQGYTRAIAVTVDNTTGQVTFTAPATALPNLVKRQPLGQFVASVTVTATHTPIVNGTSYYYSVVRLSKTLPQLQSGSQTSTSGTGTGTGTGGTNFQPTRQTQNVQGYTIAVSQAAPPFGPVTPLDRPTLVSPPNSPAVGSDSINLGNVTFQWQAVTGADVYVVQVSDDIRFPKTSLWESDVDEGVLIQTSATAGTPIIRTFTTVDNRFPGTTRRTFFWRVGARNSRDAVPPTSTNLNDTGYVFSSPFAFTTSEAPPPPPAQTTLKRMPLGPTFDQKPPTSVKSANNSQSAKSGK